MTYPYRYSPSSFTQPLEAFLVSHPSMDGILEPPLPYELERYIFELAATNPEDPYRPPLHLLLVSKPVYHEIRPIICRSLILKDEAQLSRFPTDACKYIEHISIDRPNNGLNGFLLQCPRLRVFRSSYMNVFDVSGDEAHDSLTPSARLRLEKLYCVWMPTYKATASAKALLRIHLAGLTHLDTSTWLSMPQMLTTLLGSLAGLTKLTHLGIQCVASQDTHILDQILSRPSGLRVVIVYQSDWHRVHYARSDGRDTVQHGINTTPMQKEDVRLVQFVMPDYDPDMSERVQLDRWLGGIYHHRLDYWGVAEGIREARIGGYFLNPDDAWCVIPTREGLAEVLHPWGLVKLAQRSELWADFLEIHQ